MEIKAVFSNGAISALMTGTGDFRTIGHEHSKTHDNQSHTVHAIFIQ